MAEKDFSDGDWCIICMEDVSKNLNKHVHEKEKK